MPAHATAHPARPVLSARPGLTARTAATGAMAGGVLLGGVVVAALTLAGRLSGFGLLHTSTALFLVGAFLGFVHGAVLGVVGREPGTSVREAVQSVVHGALFAVLGLSVSWLVSAWTALSVAARYLERPGTTFLVAVAWVGTALVLLAALRPSVRALRNAVRRWEDRRVGFALFLVGFAALMALLTTGQPVLWGLRLQLVLPAAVLLSLFGAFWIVGPALTLGLAAARWLHEHAVRPTRPLRISDLAVGTLVGLVAGAVALPFAQVGGMVGGAPGTLALALSHAFVNEILFRVVLVTAAAALFFRWHGHRGEAAVLAVLFAAVVQALAYLPGVVQVGFPSVAGAVGFVATVVLLPALAFGALYWKRGLPSVLAADATAVVLLVLLAL